MVKVRCFGAGDPLYEAYHDEEWGRPVADSPDERELFERVCLEGFQAGLSWITVLRKRDAFRAACAASGLDEERVRRQRVGLIVRRLLLRQSGRRRPQCGGDRGGSHPQQVVMRRPAVSGSKCHT